MGRQLSEAQLDDLVAQATVDAYDDEEQLTGLFTMITDISPPRSGQSSSGSRSP